MPRNLNEIVHSWIRLLQTQDCASSSYEVQTEGTELSKYTFLKYKHKRKKIEEIGMHHRSNISEIIFMFLTTETGKSILSLLI